eukprot:m.216762 g.216762  ORF g.216762 m.216762 type:complete len:302 (-) comp26234_c1_seq1:60-965(-)
MATFLFLLLFSNTLVFLPVSLAATTCPLDYPGCSPKNVCNSCHHTCVYCQNVGGASDVCGERDCMTCLPGLHHVEFWDDNTGPCVHESTLYKATCPQKQKGCLPRNACEVCHESCLYCQSTEADCGAKDCISCQPGLQLHSIFQDGSGECLPEGIKVDKFQLTCPESTPGCSTKNRCVQCHNSCDSCQNFDTKDGVCGPEDCMSCSLHHAFVKVHDDGRGICETQVQPRRPAKPRLALQRSGEVEQFDNSQTSTVDASDSIRNNSSTWVALGCVAVLLAVLFLFRSGGGQTSKDVGGKRVE